MDDLFDDLFAYEFVFKSYTCYFNFQSESSYQGVDYEHYESA